MNARNKSGAIVGIAWYRSDQWDAVRAFCEDRDEMDSTYKVWEKGARKAMRELRSKGQHVVVVDFDLDEFKMWCSANNKGPVRASLTELVLSKVRKGM